MSQPPRDKRFTSLKEFLPFHLTEHRNPTNGILHFTGTALIGPWIILAMITGKAWWLILVPAGDKGSLGWAMRSSNGTNRPRSNTRSIASRVTSSCSVVS